MASDHSWNDQALLGTRAGGYRKVRIGRHRAQESKTFPVSLR